MELEGEISTPGSKSCVGEFHENAQRGRCRANRKWHKELGTSETWLPPGVTSSPGSKTQNPKGLLRARRSGSRPLAAPAGQSRPVGEEPLALSKSSEQRGSCNGTGMHQSLPVACGTALRGVLNPNLKGESRKEAQEGASIGFLAA